MIPGEVVTADGVIELNPGRARVGLTVENTGDRPVQVGSHYHFAAVNPALSFDRTAAHGYRLDIPAGTSVRFEPGVTMDVDAGGAGRAARRASACARSSPERSMAELSRSRYAALYGPTTGDRVRLADTDLLIEVTEDRCGGPGRLAGDEALFGGGKVIRESMGQAVADPGRGHARPGHHRRCRARPLGRDQGRRRHPRRPDRGTGQGRQPRHHGRRHALAGHRPVDRGPRRQRADPHRRRHRQPRPPDRAAADAGGPRGRHDHADRRRHRAGRGHQGDHGDAGRVLARRDARLAHGVADELRAAGQGQHHVDGRAVGATAGRGRRVQAARGLGHHAGGDRRLPDRGPGRRRPGGDPHRHAQRGRLPRVDAGRHRRPADPHVPHRGGRRRSRPGHHPGGGASQRAAVLDQSDPAVHRATPSTNTSTC